MAGQIPKDVSGCVLYNKFVVFLFDKREIQFFKYPKFLPKKSETGEAS